MNNSNRGNHIRSNGIVKTFNENDFINEFKSYDRMDNFSYKGLRVLFESLDELANDCDMNIEMDVIALCCDYSELSLTDIINEYDLNLDDVSYDSLEDYVSSYLHINTFVCGSYELDGELHFLYQTF